ncbi:neutral/alkaline non-lysosomal ceramidase N-terminal domain-containing protein [Rhodopirellula sp. JC639]|uniref:neutral/alkaline non-lysosomal ceramidase N-terminal domain-containing protein n=1 Tax=Stieleria mannarensis TaxID=2755585 RepID=UPI0016012A07|nr:neutral/alkaline non-lysosomal ceramidase N-terminal domain-containing protein [Rhodopirellula sp. JC639]
MNSFRNLTCAIFSAAFSLIVATAAPAAATWRAGFAKQDVTPTEPVRMSGYGNRDHASEGIDTPLFVRAVCLQASTEDAQDAPLVLLSIDNIGLSGAHTRRLASEIESKHAIPRERVVFCSTHTHSGPDLGGQLSNIFSTPLSQAEAQAAARYVDRLDAAIVAAVAAAMDHLQPARLAYGVGRAGFAANRRVLTDGKWSGFGVQPDGPVDHAVPVLRITSPEGTVRGLVFNYACHCTTVGGDYYKINADWAGYAATALEASFPEAVALCTIGCGADANPNPRGTVQMAELHGQTLAAEVQRVARSQLSPIDASVQARFDYAALSFDLPTKDELEARLGESRPQTRRHAEQMLKVLKEKGRLPATYPVPIQSWKFGDQLTMIFLGGEVVVDYALRLKRTFDEPDLWVSAYSNDVLGYIASERMRAEGGYEYDRSGIYYSLPGPWASGSEDLLIRRVEEIVNNSGRPKPLDPATALQTIQVADDYQVELVAAEPLVQDPVNIAFGDDGNLWVVEMGDYPEGNNGGRVKSLTDVDGDGTFDRATTFLDGLPFPTGVQPWKDGVLISAAPDILFARDTTGDGLADDVQTLYTGFRLANPQHRINGFTYGLDHSLHLAAGDNLGELKSVQTGQTINASGHDVQIWPDSGRIEVTSGRTQFVRSRDSFGRWFGNNNSLPMYHFPIEERYLQRNSTVSYAGNKQQLFTPAVAPPVFPLTSSAERFNDLFAANRFTSACSSIVARSPHFVDNDRAVAFVCEPVHNLVHRATLMPRGATFQARRLESESDREFLASSDPWFRPVRASIGPDGMLYIVDMYREVIEHPEWIPDAWQERLDLRSGEQFGRIYRVRPRGVDLSPSPVLRNQADDALVQLLRSPVGPLRDHAQRILLHRATGAVVPALTSMATDDASPFARLHALSILDAAETLDDSTLGEALADSHPGVLIVAARLSARRVSESEIVLQRLGMLAGHEDASVALQAALVLGESKSAAAGKSLAQIATRPDLDQWIADAVASSATAHAAVVADAMIRQASEHPEQLTEQRIGLLGSVLATANQQGTPIESIVASRLGSPDLDFETQLRLAECFVTAVGQSDANRAGLASVLGPLQQQAERVAVDVDQADSMRCRAVSLIGLNLNAGQSGAEFLMTLLDPATPAAVQCEAITGLLRQDDSETFNAVIGRWPSFSIAVRDHLVSQLLARRQPTERLLEALQDKRIGTNEISLAAREQLLKSGSRSMRVMAQQLFQSGGSKPRGEIVRDYLAGFSPRGTGAEAAVRQELQRGRMLFEKHCGVCHSPDPGGVAIGASLENLTNRSDAALVEAILDPNRAVEPKYQSYVLQTDEGRTLAGVIESEVGGSMTIAHADGKRTTIRRDQIERIKSTGTSLMPEGFETTLNVQDLQAIVRHLQR